MSLPLIVAAILAWWPYPVVDTCTPVLAVLGGGVDAEMEATRLSALGHVAVASVAEGLDGASDPVAVMRLLEVLASHRDARSHAAIRPFLFHQEPDVAAFATRVLSLSTGARGLPDLEYLLTADRSFGQTLAAIEGLRELGLATSFKSLSRFFAGPGHDAILRGLALDAAIVVDSSAARKWLGKVRMEPDAPAWLTAKFAEVKTRMAAARR